MSDDPALAPGVPDDYYAQIAAVEAGHWWHKEMRTLTALLLDSVLRDGARSLLDAGCGTGGFLRWAATTGRFDRLAGSDVSVEAISRARAAGSSTELRVAPLSALPFEDGGFDIVTVNDVLQHVVDGEVDVSLRECRRVLRPGGRLMLRVGGARVAHSQRADWRLYDPPTIREALVRAGLRPERVTYVSTIPSLWSVARGTGPRAPEAGEQARHGIPAVPSAMQNRLGRATSAVERRWLASGRDLPYGHTLMAIARRDP